MKVFSILSVARAAGMLCIFAGLAMPSAFAEKDPAAIIIAPATGTEPIPAGRVTKDLNGVVETGENLTLRLNTDLGSVHVISLERGAAPVVRYAVHIETDAHQPQAAQLLEHYVLNVQSSPSGIEITGNLPQQVSHGGNGAQFWVHFEVMVPASYGLDVSTGAGDILTSDVGGAATLATEGGNIVTGKLSTNLLEASRRHAHSAMRAGAKLQTEGGHIQVEGAEGGLNAFTAGGHINTGYIQGEAILHSGGGHIRAAGIGGKADLTTEGGNITVGKAGSFVAVKTGGGQIDFGEVRGSVHAQTGGGGIRVMYVSGPMDVESSGGSICLTRVSGSVRAETGSGTITAWINPDSSSVITSATPHAESTAVSLSGASQLISGEGDIIVFLPRNLAANIEAIVERGGEHRIQADPALALQIAKSAQSNGPMKAVAALNGGGPILKLKTTGGKIKLQYLESEPALWDAMMRDQRARMERDLAMTPVPVRAMQWPEAYLSPNPTPRPALQPEQYSAWPGTWVDRIEMRLLGGVREDGDDFLRRVVSAPPPGYPDVARKAGIEGVVRLQVRLKQDGRIEVEKLLDGDTVLADAAIAAVKQWRGKPVAMDGKPVDVISTVKFEFHLR
jgi:TonB family protein